VHIFTENIFVEGNALYSYTFYGSHEDLKQLFEKYLSKSSE